MRPIPAAMRAKLLHRFKAKSTDSVPNIRLVATQTSVNTLLTEPIREDIEPAYGDVAFRQMAGEDTLSLAYAISVEDGTAKIYQRKLPANFDYQWTQDWVQGENTTIGKSGCGPTSAAMLLATLTGDLSINPKTECAWALAHGYKALNSGTYYGYFTPAFLRYGITCIKLNGATIYGNAASKYHAQAKAALDAGNYVIACMGRGNWTSSGHYVVVYGIDGDTVYINDPASTKTRRTQGSYALFKQQVKYYWVISTPIKEENDDMNMEQTKTIAREVAVQVVQEMTPAVASYNSVADCPDWARATVQKMVDKGYVNGELDGQLNLSYDLLRLLVVNDRAGLYG